MSALTVPPLRYAVGDGSKAGTRENRKKAEIRKNAALT
jgi:hypothetical protein